MRRHYEKLDQQAIAKRNVVRRLGAECTGNCATEQCCAEKLNFDEYSAL